MESKDLLKLLGDCRRALVRLRSGGIAVDQVGHGLIDRLVEGENAVADLPSLLSRDQVYAAVLHHDGLLEELVRDEGVAQLNPEPGPTTLAPLPVRESCATCGGIGTLARGNEPVACPWCNGTGGAL